MAERGVEYYTQLAIANFGAFRPGAYYGAADGLAAGAGLFFPDVAYPKFNTQTSKYAVVEGVVYILTHECDIDPDNIRPFNEFAVVCPMTRLEDLVEVYKEAGEEDKLHSLIMDMAADRIQRVFFLPPPSDVFDVPALSGGAFLYLNALTSVHVSFLAEGSAVCALSEEALQRLDAKLQNHLFRPKADLLPGFRA